MSKYLESLELSTRTLGILKLLGVDSESALLAVTSKQFLSTPGAGRKSLNELQELKQELVREKKRNSHEGRTLAMIRQLNLQMRMMKEHGYYLAQSRDNRELMLCKHIQHDADCELMP